MWSSRLFWKLFLSYAALILACVIAFVVIVLRSEESQLREQVERRLHDTAAVVRSHVSSYWQDRKSDELQTLVVSLAEETGSRITLVLPDGKVVADSDQNPDLMENHRDRIELAQAADTGEGSSQRTSPTLNIPMLYLALRADRDGKPVGLVRVAMRMTAIEEQIAKTQRLIWTIAALITLSVLVLTYWVVARIVGPLATLTGAARNIASGDYQQRIQLASKDELGELAAAFNRMSGELAKQISRLKESGGRLATVLSSMTDGVIALDSEEHILLANEAAGQLLGFVPEQSEGRALLEVVRNHALRQAFADAIEKRAPQQTIAETDTTPSRTLAVGATPLPGDPCPGVVLVLHDVTEVRKLERLRQEFVANVSHELKTPLTAIKAYAETLSRGALEDHENRESFVEQIEQQADRLHQLIQDMLSLARIESGNTSLEIAAVPLRRVVDQCIDTHRAVADSHRVSLSTDVDVAAVQVRANEEGLRQILDNLVDNAIKYTPEHGSVTIGWQVDSAHVVIEVRDTGIGIAEEHHARLFERFFRVDKARSRELGGTGLGLSIVKHIAQGFDGSVGVRSQPDEGSTFWVRLPLV